MRLRGVLEHLEVVRARDLVDRVHVRAAPVQVHGDDRPRPGRERALDTQRVDRPRRGVGVDQHRDGAGALDAGDGRHACVGGRHDLVSALDAEGSKTELDRVGAGAHGRAGETVAAVRREGPLELLDSGAEDEPALVDDLRNRAVELGAEPDESPVEPEERNVHVRSQYASPCSR